NGSTVALRVGGANISYLQADQHGTNQVSVKAAAADNHVVSRRTFDPYGNAVGMAQGAWPDQHAFLNLPQSPDTGLSDVGVRTYDSATGRFLSVDPMLDPASPQQWTGYGYANGNPVTLSDPDGRHPICGMNHGDCGYEGEAWESDPVAADAMDAAVRVKRV